MTVEFLKDFTDAGGHRYTAGQITEIPDAVAKGLVAVGTAREYKSREGTHGAETLDDDAGAKGEPDGEGDEE